MWREKVYAFAYELSDKLLQLFIANVLWVVLNSPILFLIIQLQLASETSSFYILVPLLVLGLPIFFFPSTQALFCVMRDIATQRQFSMIRTYWSYLLSNFKDSLVLGICSVGLLVGIGVSLYYSWYSSVILFTVVLIILLITLLIILQIFAFQAQFDMPIKWKLNRCRQLVFARPIYSIGTFMLVILLIYAGFGLSLAFFICITPAASAYIVSLLFQVQYHKIVSSARLKQMPD